MEIDIDNFKTPEIDESVSTYHSKVASVTDNLLTEKPSSSLHDTDKPIYNLTTDQQFGQKNVKTVKRHKST